MTQDWWDQARLKIEGGVSHPTDFGFDAESFAGDVQEYVYSPERQTVWEMEVDADGDVAIFDAEDEEAMVGLSADSLTFVTAEVTPEEALRSEKVAIQARMVGDLFTTRKIPRVDECWITLSASIELDDARSGRVREFFAGHLAGQLTTVLSDSSGVSEVAIHFDLGQAKCLFRVGESPGGVLAQVEVRETGETYHDFFERAVPLATKLMRDLLGLPFKE
jgi:hypothetical protein